jgi:formylglycine-generating enzyme
MHAKRLLVVAYLLGVLMTVEPQVCNAQNSQIFENSVGMKFVHVPAGQFTFGPHDSPIDLVDDDGKAISVSIAPGLLMQQHEVSIKTFAKFCKEDEYATARQKEIRAGTVANDGENIAAWRNSNSEFPMNNVTFDDCVNFCKWLSRKEGRTYRLPTEIEWEYCCLLGSDGAERPEQFNTPQAWLGHWKMGDDKPEGLPLGEFRNGPREVDEGNPDALGLFNMRGNVQEFCDSWWGARTKLREPSRLTGSVIAVVVRGGAWTQAPMWAQAKKRSWHNALRYSESTGFRVILDERTSDVTKR